MQTLIWANLIHLGLTLAGSALILVLLHLQERSVGRYLAHRLGWRSVLVTGWLGVPLHELSHLLTAMLFGHRIIAWSLFDPDPVTGTLGYVRHAYSRRNPLQIIGNAFIGSAPPLAGALAIWGIACWILPATERAAITAQVGSISTVGASNAAELWTGFKALSSSVGAAIWTHRSPWLPVQLYLAICVTSHMAPSAADLKGALPGAALLGLCLAAAGTAAGHLGVNLGGEAEAILVTLTLLLGGAAFFQASYAGLVAIAQRLTNRIRFRQTGGRTGSA